MSDSESSSSSLHSLRVEPRTKKSKTSGKGKGKPTKDGHGKNEGVDPNWAYEPPEGMPVNENVGESEEYDWDMIEKNSDLELWVIRVPDGVKPKHFENLTIDFPKGSKSGKVGEIQRKNEAYDVWNFGDGGDMSVGGQEVKSLTCLLPQKKKKEHRIAPSPLARHLVVTVQPPKPSEDDSAPGGIVVTQNPPRFSYPKELLSHQYVAFGSRRTDEAQGGDEEAEEDDTMDVDSGATSQPQSQSQSHGKEKRKSERSAKKRKTAEEVEMPSPKKQKKHKK